MGNKLHLYADVTDRFAHLSGANDTLEGLETVIGVKLLLLHKIWMLICDLNAVFLSRYTASTCMEQSWCFLCTCTWLSGLLRTTRSHLSLMAHLSATNLFDSTLVVNLHTAKRKRKKRLHNEFLIYLFFFFYLFCSLSILETS